MSIDSWLQQVWYERARAPWWLRVLAVPYGFVARLRAGLYRRGWLRSVRVAAPVIVVGNITVGGTGKTPLVIWLVTRLRALGIPVAVVTRGYGRNSTGRVTTDILRVDENCRAIDVGDEALLIRLRTGCPVYVSRDRVAAARAAIADGARVIVADDGLQHLRLARDVEVVLVDGQRGLGNGALLPAGPLRESRSRLAGVDAIVLAEPGAGAPPGDWSTALRMSLSGELLQPVNRAALERTVRSFGAQRVHAVAGIGNPRRFFATLESAGLNIIPHRFPDHHRYVPRDLDFGDSLAVIMTEKDAVKCRSFAPGECWCLPVSASFAAADERNLLRRILMDARLLDILACPLCKGPLRLADDAGGEVLVCRADRLAFPVREGIPVMLEEAARQLNPDDPLLER
ncbi:MAG: tetraacyldisaccharide 4'-kinase [Steroidobacteraceae bacterium]